MHCSGTSATARLVNLLGIDLGPPEVGAPARRSNTRGLWEHPELTALGERILQALGGSWSAPPPLEPGWHRAAVLEPHRETASRLVRSTFGSSPSWGWKDPRNCLLVPFWEDLLGPLQHVICIRDPRDVASSLERRDGMTKDQATELWVRYTTAVLVATEKCPRIIICFEDLWSGPAALSRLAGFLGRPEAAEAPEFRAAVAGWLDRSLWHHRAGAGLPPVGDHDDAGQLYVQLRDTSRGRPAEPSEYPPPPHSS